MYYLDNYSIGGDGRYPWTVYIVGCGGTGGYVSEGLARILPREASIILVDHDRIEERNISRQNFLKREVGELKSVALARRLSERYDRPIGYSTFPIGMTRVDQRGLIVGCVDNGIARTHIADNRGNFYWWVDAGNGMNYGQVLIGNGGGAIFNSKTEKVTALPLPSIQRPEILTQAPENRGLNCLDIVEQGPTINSVMASVVVEVVRRLTDGTCPWMQIVLDMEHGTMSPVMATPEIAREMFAGKDCKVTVVAE